MSRPIQATTYLILAMREKWLNLILDGKKTAEVRRTRPRGDVMNRDDFFYITLYFYNKGLIHGMAQVDAFACLEYFRREQMGDWCRKACLTPAEMDKYLDGAARPIVYELGKVQRFPKPIPVPCRPQSWQYATPELLEIIQDRKETSNHE